MIVKRFLLGHTRRTGLSAFALAGALAGVLALTPASASAQAVRIYPAVSRDLNAASVGGPAALLDALGQKLQADPSLAATADRAAALAGAAAAPVADFIGATTPIYRAIAERIIAAAPPAQRAAVRGAVAAELNRVIQTNTHLVAPPGPNQGGVVPPAPPRVAGPGYRAGPFMIYPDIQASTFFDDNIYATRTARKSDIIGTISPSIAVQSEGPHKSLYAEAQVDLTGYMHHPHENTVDWHAGLEGRIDATDTTRLLLGAQVLQSHEDRASPDAVNGLTPTPYTEFHTYGGVQQRVGDFSIRLGAALERVTFDNVQGTHGEINNQDRNRNRYTFGLSVYDEANPNFRPFVETLGDLRRYDQTTDDFGYKRSSAGYRVGIGALFRLSPSLSGDVFIGVMGQNYEDPRFEGVTTVAFDGSLRWNVVKGTALVLYSERSIEETTLAGSPAYIYTIVGGRVEHALTSDLTGIARLAWGHSDFVQTTRTDEDVDTSVGLHYHLSPTLTVGVDYRYTQRVSGDTTADFNRNQVYFRIGKQF